MKNYLKETLIFDNIFGIDTTFDFITGRDYFKYVYDINHKEKTENTNNNIIIAEKINKFDNNFEKSNNDKNLIINEENMINNVKKMLESNLKNISNIEDLILQIKNFNKCSLKENAKNDVIYDGNIRAKILLIGEAPGENEDEEGKPFCGKSGQLLRKALKCINLTNENLLITNTVYWRPPNNRKPYEEEIEMCRPFLNKIIEITDPKIVILCGSTAIETIMNYKKSISEIVGKTQDINIKVNDNKILKLKVFPIYHPSYLLRVPSMKKIFWKHLLNLQNELKNIL